MLDECCRYRVQTLYRTDTLPMLATCPTRSAQCTKSSGHVAWLPGVSPLTGTLNLVHRRIRRPPPLPPSSTVGVSFLVHCLHHLVVYRCPSRPPPSHTAMVLSERGASLPPLTRLAPRSCTMGRSVRIFKVVAFSRCIVQLVRTCSPVSSEYQIILKPASI
jgi:hypothetical protein